MLGIIMSNVDPITGLLLVGMWFRLEQYAKRLNRIESEFIETNDL